MTAVEWLANELTYKTDDGRYIVDNTDDVTDIVNQAKQMEKERLLEFGSKVAMKAHTGKSGWSIIEVYNENK
jgi:hypothetical protein